MILKENNYLLRIGFDLNILKVDEIKKEILKKGKGE